eukprot:Nk52_evm6s1360 gene=Nk52_evmTU6s1360
MSRGDSYLYFKVNSPTLTKKDDEEDENLEQENLNDSRSYVSQFERGLHLKKKQKNIGIPKNSTRVTRGKRHALENPKLGVLGDDYYRNRFKNLRTSNMKGILFDEPEHGMNGTCPNLANIFKKRALCWIPQKGLFFQCPFFTWKISQVVDVVDSESGRTEKRKRVARTEEKCNCKPVFKEVRARKSVHLENEQAILVFGSYICQNPHSHIKVAKDKDRNAFSKSFLERVHYALMHRQRIAGALSEFKAGRMKTYLDKVQECVGVLEELRYKYGDSWRTYLYNDSKHTYY